MNELGVHALVWVAGWSDDECARAIEQTAEVGYDFIEASAPEPSAIDIDFTRRQLESHGIGINLSLGLSADDDISSGDREKGARGKRRLEDAVRVCRDLGGRYVGGILHSAFQKNVSPTTSAGVAMSADIMGEVASMASESGITLVMEVVNRYESNLLNTASQGVEYCRRGGGPNGKVHLDTYHMNIEEADIGAAIRDTGPDLGYFHIGDSHRGYMGSGSINFTEVFRSLAAIDYAGPIAFESFSARVVGQPLEGILGVWRDLWDDGHDLASHALLYTRAQMKSAQEARKQAERSRLP